MRQEYLRAQQKKAARRRQAIALLIVIGLVLLITVAFPALSNKKKKTTAPKETTVFGTTNCPPADGSAARTTTFPDSFKKCIKPTKKYTANIETDVGTIVVALAAKDSPVTTNNFVALARYHFYDSLTCHRVLKNFMDQCGDPAGNGSGGPGYSIGEEPPKSGKYVVGDLAMAKTSQPHSTGSQIFLIVGDQGTALPPEYSLLGTMTSGLDVAKKIEADGADADPAPPTVTHKFLKVTITES